MGICCESGKLAHDIDIKFLHAAIKKQNNKCAISGIEFESTPNGIGLRGRSPWSVSIDRIDSLGGYTQDNVQIVCLIYNLCKSSWSHNEVLKLAKAIK